MEHVVAEKYFPVPFIPDVSSLSSGVSIPRPACVRLKRLQTGVGLFRSTLSKSSMALTAASECAAKE